MDLLDPKALKKFVDSCRKAGITSFKGFGVEFTLDALPPKQTRRRSRKTQEAPTIQVQGPAGPISIPSPVKPQEDKIETDSLTDDQLLFWSSGGGDENQESSQ